MDEFEVMVYSSKETRADFCDWTKLSIDEVIQGSRTYDIVGSDEEPNRMPIFVSTNFVEEGTGPGEGCIDQLTMSLET